MFWIADGREPKDAFTIRSKLEIPPPGYTGTLVGTGWDQDTMVDEYDTAAGNIASGQMK